MKISWEGHISMLSANIMWGLMSPLAKYVIISGAVTPLILTNFRIFGAMILFWVASFFCRPEHVPAGDLLRLFVAALLGIVFNQGCFIFGVGMTSPADASIITTSMPLWAMIFAAFFLKEPITSKKILGIVTGAAGAILLIMGGRKGETTDVVGSNVALGDILVLCAQFSYALYLVLYKNFVSRYSLFTIMKWMFTFASICVLPLAFGHLPEIRWSFLSAAQIAAVAFIVVCATFIAYILVVFGQVNLRPTVAGMYNYVQPIVASIVAVCWGMDSFTGLKFVAVGLIFAGVFLVTTSKARVNSD